MVLRVLEQAGEHPCSPSKDSSAKCICRCVSKFTHSPTSEPSVHCEIQNNLAVGGKSVFVSPPVVQTVTRNCKVLEPGDALHSVSVDIENRPVCKPLTPSQIKDEDGLAGSQPHCPGKTTHVHSSHLSGEKHSGDLPSYCVLGAVPSVVDLTMKQQCLASRGSHSSNPLHLLKGLHHQDTSDRG